MEQLLRQIRDYLENIYLSQVGLGGYSINDSDEGSNPKYYGFETSAGAWYILKVDSSAGTYRYAKGDSGYSTAWTDRASQTYALYGTTF